MGEGTTMLEQQLNDTKSSVVEILSYLQTFETYYDSLLTTRRQEIEELSGQVANLQPLLIKQQQQLKGFQDALRAFFFVTVGAVATTIGMGVAVWLTK